MAWGTIELPDLDGIEERYAPKPITPTLTRRRFKPETERHRTNAERLFDNDDDVDTYLEQYEADNAPDMTPSPTLRGQLQIKKGQADTTRPAFLDPVEATREAERASSNNPLTLFDRAGDAVLKPLQRKTGDVAEAVGGQIPDFKVRRPGLFGQDLPLEYEEDDGTRTELGKTKVSVKPGKVARFGAEAIVPGSTEDLALMAGTGVLGKVGGAAIKARAAGKTATAVEEGVETAARSGVNDLVPSVGFGIRDTIQKFDFTMADGTSKTIYARNRPKALKILRDTDKQEVSKIDVSRASFADATKAIMGDIDVPRVGFGIQDVDEDIYHGTAAQFEGLPSLSKSGSRFTGGKQQVIYTSRDPDTAGMYSDVTFGDQGPGAGSRIIPMVLKKDTKFWNPETDPWPDFGPKTKHYKELFEQEKTSHIEGEGLFDYIAREAPNDKELDEVIKVLKADGYKAVKTWNETAILDESAIASKFDPSRLADETPMERLMRESMEKIQTEGRPAAQQAFKANADETAEAMARETAAKGDQYAEATRLSKRVAALTDDLPEAARKTAVSKTKKLLDEIVEKSNKALGAIPKVGLSVEDVSKQTDRTAIDLAKKTTKGRSEELVAKERYLRGEGVARDFPEVPITPIAEKPPNGLLNNLAAIANASKRVQPTGDIMGVQGRQNLQSAFIDPRIWGRNAKRTFKAYFEDPQSAAAMDDIARIPRWADDDPRNVVRVIDEAGQPDYIALKGGREVFGVGDDFQTPGFERIGDTTVDRFIDKVDAKLGSISARSEKAMRVGMLGTGMDTLNGLYDSAIKAGISDPDWYDFYGGLAKTSVGYGDVPKWLKGLSNGFYSLRNTAARFQTFTKPLTSPGHVFSFQDPNPIKGALFSASPKGAATRQLMRFAAGETANMRFLAFAGSQSGLFDVGWNPLEPGYGRITFEDEEGNDYSTDLLGGYGSQIKALAHSAYTAKQIQEGVPREEWKFDPVVDWINFGRNKTAGLTSTVIDTAIANSGLADVEELESSFAINITDPATWKEGKFLNWFTPFFLQDTVQGLISGDLDTSPTGLLKSGGVLLAQGVGVGLNVYEPTTRDVRDIVAQEKGHKDFASANPEEQKLIDMDERVVKQKDKDPNAYSRAVKEEIGPLLEKRDQAEAAAKEGNLSTKITDTWHELRVQERAKRGTLVNTYLKGIDNNKDATRKAIDGFYSNEVENADGTVDWDKTDAKQQQWMRTQTPEIGEYIASYLRAQRLDESEMYQEYLGFNDKREQAGLFDDTKTPADKEAIYAKNPDLDVQQWYFGGGVVKDGKPVAGPALQSDAAVKAALARQLPNRPIKRDGLPRPVNESPQTVKAWNYSKNPVQFYLDAGGTKNLDTYSREEFGVPYARLKPEDKTKIKGQVRSDLLEDDENLKAWLIFWGAHKIGKNTDDETIEQVNKLYRQYGAPPKEPLVKR